MAGDAEEFVKALFSCEGEEAEELTFERGDVFELIARNHKRRTEWWHVRNAEGVAGCLPSNYVTECTADGGDLDAIGGGGGGREEGEASEVMGGARGSAVDIAAVTAAAGADLSFEVGVLKATAATRNVFRGMFSSIGRSLGMELKISDPMFDSLFENVRNVEHLLNTLKVAAHELQTSLDLLADAKWSSLTQTMISFFAQDEELAKASCKYKEASTAMFIASPDPASVRRRTDEDLELRVYAPIAKQLAFHARLRNQFRERQQKSGRVEMLRADVASKRKRRKPDERAIAALAEASKQLEEVDAFLMNQVSATCFCFCGLHLVAHFNFSSTHYFSREPAYDVSVRQSWVRRRVRQVLFTSCAPRPRKPHPQALHALLTDFSLSSTMLPTTPNCYHPCIRTTTQVH